MRITSEEAGDLRKELKALKCTALKGDTKWEVIFTDPNGDIIARLKAIRDETNDLILTTYNTRKITWRSIPRNLNG